MKILVTFAVAAEFAVWRRHHDFFQVSSEPFPVYTAEIGGSTTRVLLTGIGNEMAAEAMRWALRSPADICISSGFAGALCPSLRVGEVLAARVVRRAEKELAVASDRDLLSAASEAGAKRVDRFLTSERLIVSGAEKTLLAEQADAVEMESFLILAEAARRGVRAVAVRSASDTAGTSLPYDFDTVCDERGRIRVGSLLAGMVSRPQRIPALLRLARDCRLAARQLAVFLDDYLRVLEARMEPSQSEMVATL